MRAVVWHGKEDVRVDSVPDPRIEKPTDAIVRITQTAICGSDLHLYAKIGRPFMRAGDILGHEPMGVVEEVGDQAAAHLQPGDTVVMPFNIACGSCFMCERDLHSQCETTQNRKWRKGASLFGYTHMYGGIPGGQAELLRVPLANFGPIKVPEGAKADRFLFLSDVLPTAWQGVAYADVRPGSTVAVWGLGPIGQMCARIALRFGADRVIGIDGVPERLAMAQRHGVETVDFRAVDSAWRVVRELTDGRGVDCGIDCVGMESEAGPVARALQALKLMPDRLNALVACIRSIRRGGTLSIVGVYIGVAPGVPLGEWFDRQITVRLGQANVRRWTHEIVPLLVDDTDPLGVDDLVTHRLPLEEAPRAYDIFQRKLDGAIKIVLEPRRAAA